MCTLTIHRGVTELQITMNRDEQRRRVEEIAPSVVEGDAVGPWMAPWDGRSDGTWMGVNAHGLVACLLNLYLPSELDATSEERDGEGMKRGRGDLVPQALAHASLGEAVHWTQDVLDPTPYQSFTLLLATVNGMISVAWHRQGSVVLEAINDDWTLLTSSSWKTEQVLRWRRLEFKEWVEQGANFDGPIPTYNLLQAEGMAEWSPLMSRDRTCTRSITQISVTPLDERISLRYWPWPGLALDSNLPDTRLDLPLLPAHNSLAESRTR
jgi:hypothetical protein